MNVLNWRVEMMTPEFSEEAGLAKSVNSQRDNRTRTYQPESGILFQLSGILIAEMSDSERYNRSRRGCRDYG